MVRYELVKGRVVVEGDIMRRLGREWRVEEACWMPIGKVWLRCEDLGNGHGLPRERRSIFIVWEDEDMEVRY